MTYPNSDDCEPEDASGLEIKLKEEDLELKEEQIDLTKQQLALQKWQVIALFGGLFIALLNILFNSVNLFILLMRK